MGSLLTLVVIVIALAALTRESTIEVSKVSEFRTLAWRAVHYDLALTHTSLLSAFDHADTNTWAAKHANYSTFLGGVIEDILHSIPPCDANVFRVKTGVAEEVMLSLEARALNYTRHGLYQEAAAIFKGEHYLRNQEIFRDGIADIHALSEIMSRRALDRQNASITSICVLLVLAVPALFFTGLTAFRSQTRAQVVLNKERAYGDTLVASMFPAHIVKAMKDDPEWEVIANQHTSVCVLFADVVNFTEMARGMTALQVVHFLRDLFAIFDDALDLFQVEKIKTVGDQYMAVSGLTSNQNHVRHILNFALHCRNAVKKAGLARMRFGIHTGTAVSGVLGNKKTAFDVWGDTVNLAARLESNGVPDEIQVSKEVVLLAQKAFEFEERPHKIMFKGYGEITAYFLRGPGEVTAEVPSVSFNMTTYLSGKGERASVLGEIVEDELV